MIALAAELRASSPSQPPLSPLAPLACSHPRGVSVSERRQSSTCISGKQLIGRARRRPGSFQRRAMTRQAAQLGAGRSAEAKNMISMLKTFSDPDLNDDSGQKSGGKGAPEGIRNRTAHAAECSPLEAPAQKPPGYESFVPKSISLDEPGAPSIGDAKAFPLLAALLHLFNSVSSFLQHHMHLTLSGETPHLEVQYSPVVALSSLLYIVTSAAFFFNGAVIMGALMAAITLTSLFSDSIDPASRFWCRWDRILCTLGAPCQRTTALRHTAGAPQQLALCAQRHTAVASRGSRLPLTRASTSDRAPAASAQPSPPAGFILNEEGEVVLMAPEEKRIVTLRDSESGRSLECVIRRTFMALSNLQFFLLYPLDVPIIVYRVNKEQGKGLIEIEDAEIQDVFPTASYALARRNFHLVMSAYVLSVRGAVCFNEDDVTRIDTEYGMGIGSDLAEGVEIASFTLKGNKYVVYTPFDPLLFVAYRDPDTGELVVAEDEEDLDDPKVVAAIEEEQEFQRMVNVEEEMKQSMPSK